MSYVALMCLLFLKEDTPVIQEELKVEYVLLDVAAVDRKGRPVKDLTANDFVIKDGRKSVDITFFNVLDYSNPKQVNASSLPESHRRLVAQNQTRQVILAVDLDSTTREDAAKSIRQLRTFVDELDPTISYQINLYSLELGTLTGGFTDNPNHIKTGLDRLQDRYVTRPQNGAFEYPEEALLGDTDEHNSEEWSGYSEKNFNGSTRPQDNHLLSQLEQTFLECRIFYCGLSRCRDPGAYNECIRTAVADFQETHKDRTIRAMNQLEILASAFEELGGLKSILFVSPGFSLEGMSSAVELSEAYLLGEPGFYTGTMADQDLRKEFRRVIHVCTKNRVMFHTFDLFNSNTEGARRASAARGGRPGNMVRAFKRYQNEVAGGLKDLAVESGGSFHSVNRLSEGMIKTINNNRFFYMIGYASPTDVKPNKFRKIKIKCKRKKVRLRYRAGYYK